MMLGFDSANASASCPGAFVNSGIGEHRACSAAVAAPWFLGYNTLDAILTKIARDNPGRSSLLFSSLTPPRRASEWKSVLEATVLYLNGSADAFRMRDNLGRFRRPDRSTNKKSCSKFLTHVAESLRRSPSLTIRPSATSSIARAPASPHERGPAPIRLPANPSIGARRSPMGRPPVRTPAFPGERMPPKPPPIMHPPVAADAASPLLPPPWPRTSTTVPPRVPENCLPCSQLRLRHPLPSRRPRRGRPRVIRSDAC